MTWVTLPCHTAQVDTFLLKKQRQLGELLRVKVGHDNSGVGPGA